MSRRSKSFRNIASETARFAGVSSWQIPERPLLLWLTDAIFVALIVVFPFIMGGREAWGHRILITLSMALGFCWCLHRIRTGGKLVLLSLEPLMLAGLLLVWLQAIPITGDVLRHLSGEYERLLPAPATISADTSNQPASSLWSSASLYPTETKHGLLILASYVVIAVVSAQRITSEQDCHHLLKLVGVSGLLMTAFAVVQLVTSNDYFFWFYRQPYTGTREVLKGAFTNRNHFAQFLSLSIGPLIWWMLIGRTSNVSVGPARRSSPGPAQGSHSSFDRVIDPRLILLICATGGVLLAIMLSLSRGGMISAGLACVVCLAGLWKSGRVHASLAFVTLSLGVIALCGLTIFGSDSVEERVAQLASGDADQIDRLNARRSIWNADIKAIKAFPLLGTGVGSHRFVYPLYMDDLAKFPNVTFSHAESSYIHLALETGLAGLGLLAMGLLLSVGRIVLNILRTSDSARIALLTVICASLIGGMVHAAVDFIWYAPAIVVTTILLGVAGLRLCTGFASHRAIPIPRLGWFAMGAVCLFVLCNAQPNLQRRVAGERLWFQYLNADFDAALAFHEARTTSSDSDATDELLNARGLFAADNTNSAEQPWAAQSQEDASGHAGGSGHADATATYNSDSSQPASHQARAASLRDRIHLLLASLKANPDHAEASQELATTCLELFEVLQTTGDNRMSLPQIRDVVLTSEYKSDKEMLVFLKRAFGSSMRLPLLSNHFSRKALTLCPLAGKAWEVRMATDFLRDPSDKDHDHLIAQAIAIGHNSPKALHSIGLTLLQEGETEDALELWNRVFHSSRELRLSICRTLLSSHSVNLILKRFRPTLDELPEVLLACQESGRKADIMSLAYATVDAVQKSVRHDDPSADADHERHVALLMDVYRNVYRLRAYEECRTLLQLAIDCDPMSEPPRRALGLLFLDQKKYAEAEALFAWCADQLPGDAKLDELRRECRRLEANQARRIRTVGYELP
jgi:tetratricopeptide (TPR) repeat protein